MKKTDNKVVIITGASSGIGLALAKKYIASNAIVYGIGRKAFQLDGMIYYSADVTCSERISEIIDEIAEKEGKIDIVVSNAGIGISGPVETADIEDVRKIMNINFLGSFNVIKASIAIMHKQGYGRIICTSLVASFVPLPFQAFYSASKSALDSLVDATRSEVKSFGVQILSVHPGDVKTGFTGARDKQNLNEDDPYSKVCTKCVGQMERDEQGGMTADYVAGKIYKISLKKHYRVRNVIGSKYKLFSFLLSLMPRKMREWAVRKMYF